MFKKSKLFLALTLALVLCLGAALPALASGPVLGSEEHPAVAVINKTLQTTGCTTIPDVTFTFNVDKININGRPAEYPDEIPDLNDASLSLSYSDADTSTTAGGVVQIVKKSPDLFAGVEWPHAGIFVYVITENPNVYDIEDANHEMMTYSPAVYTLTVYVKNTDDGTGLYVYGYEAVVTTPDNGGQEPGTKIDAGPGTPNSPSGLLFTNSYMKTNGAVDPDDPDPTTDSESTLFVSKMVTGSLGNRERFFNFTMTLSPPALLGPMIAPDTLPDFYRAYVVENGAVVTSADNADISIIGTDAGGAYIEISTKGETAFNLKHGQKLVFVDTPVGTDYEVTELAHLNYLPTMAITHNDSTTNIPGSAINTVIRSGARHVGNTLEKVSVTNTMDEVTPTGLRLNDLPFVSLIVIAVGALVSFIVVKVRKRKEYDR